MKTIHEYEPSDITMDDPVHSFLVVNVLAALIIGIKTGPDDPKDNPLFPVNRAVAAILNNAQKSGITISKAESVPEVFRR